MKPVISPTRVAIASVLTLVSVVGINALLILHVPVVAEKYADQDKGLPAVTGFFVDLIDFIKFNAPLVILFALPIALACIPKLDRRVFYPLAVGFYAIPLAALTLPALLGWPGATLEPPDRPTAEELAAVSLWTPLHGGLPMDYDYENESIEAIAIPVKGDMEAIRDRLAPLIDSAAGGGVYIDPSRHAIVVYERRSRFADILHIIEQIQAKAKAL